MSLDLSLFQAGREREIVWVENSQVIDCFFRPKVDIEEYRPPDQVNTSLT